MEAGVGIDDAIDSKEVRSMAERQSNLQKDPDDWVTGDEPMTGN